jgi:hypothetical protein
LVWRIADIGKIQNVRGATVFKTVDDLAPIFDDLCKNASVDILESIITDIEDWEGPVAQKVRGIVNRHLQQKLCENEKSTSPSVVGA